MGSLGLVGSPGLNMKLNSGALLQKLSVRLNTVSMYSF
jgi:hypothetical protein